MAAPIPQLVRFFQTQNFLRRFDKGQLICSQGEPFDYVYMINAGMVKIYDLDNQGSERTLSIVSHNNIFPLIWLLEAPPKNHLYYYEAFADTSCYLATRDDLWSFINEHSDALLGVMDALTKAYMNLAARIRNLERSHVHERLDFVLFMLATALGTFGDEGDVANIDTIITQEDISRLAGVTRESISLEINSAQSRRMLWKDGRSTYIDVGKMDSRDLPIFYERRPGSHKNDN
jgi:CRP/FNR family cyclic AMP-dependent transcriptional regulator